MFNNNDLCESCKNTSICKMFEMKNSVQGIKMISINCEFHSSQNYIKSNINNTISNDMPIGSGRTLEEINRVAQRIKEITPISTENIDEENIDIPVEEDKIKVVIK